VIASAMFRFLHIPGNGYQGTCLNTPVRTNNARSRATTTAQVSSDNLQRLPFLVSTSALMCVLLTI
jgi:hypothetical protein